MLTPDEMPRVQNDCPKQRQHPLVAAHVTGARRGPGFG